MELESSKQKAKLKIEYFVYEIIMLRIIGCLLSEFFDASKWRQKRLFYDPS